MSFFEPAHRGQHTCLAILCFASSLFVARRSRSPRHYSRTCASVHRENGHISRAIASFPDRDTFLIPLPISGMGVVVCGGGGHAIARVMHRFPLKMLRRGGAGVGAVHRRQRLRRCVGRRGLARRWNQRAFAPDRHCLGLASSTCGAWLSQVRAGRTSSGPQYCRCRQQSVGQWISKLLRPSVLVATMATLLRRAAWAPCGLSLFSECIVFSRVVVVASS